MSQERGGLNCDLLKFNPEKLTSDILKKSSWLRLVVDWDQNVLVFYNNYIAVKLRQ